MDRLGWRTAPSDPTPTANIPHTAASTAATDTAAATETPTETQPEPINRFVIVLSVFASIGGLLFGYDTGVISGAILFIRDDFNLTIFEQECVVSGAIAGAIVGALLGGTINDWLGRKPATLISAFVFAVGGIIMAASTDFVSILTGRLIAGVGVGLSSVTVPVFVAEVAPPKHRGKLTALNVLFITGGQFFSYLIDSAFANTDNGWRWMLGLSVVPPAIQAIGMIFLPESPRYLVKKNKIDHARAVLARVLDTSADSDEVQSELAQINESIVHETRSSYFALLSARVRPALRVAVILQVFQQLCGINTAMYYSGTILSIAGFDDKAQAIFFSDFVAFANMVFTIVAMKAIDRAGRRLLLLVSICGVTAGLFLIGGAFWMGHSPAQGYFALSALVVYVAFFAVGMGCVPWTLQSEMFPLDVRGAANGLAAAGNWASNLLVSMTFLSLGEAVSTAGVFWIYGACAILTALFVYFCVPETRGKTLEEISAELAGIVLSQQMQSERNGNTVGRGYQGTSDHSTQRQSPPPAFGGEGDSGEPSYLQRVAPGVAVPHRRLDLEELDLKAIDHDHDAPVR